MPSDRYAISSSDWYERRALTGASATTVTASAFKMDALKWRSDLLGQLRNWSDSCWRTLDADILLDLRLLSWLIYCVCLFPVFQYLLSSTAGMVRR